MARLSRPPPSSSRSRTTIFSSSSESEPESNNDSNSDSEFPDIAALPPSPKRKRKVSPPLQATKRRPTPPTDTASTSTRNQTVIESATSPNAASSSVAGVKRRKLLLGAVSDNVLFRKWTPAQEAEGGVPARKKRRGLTAGTGFGLGLGMMRDEEKNGSDSEAENLVVNRKKVNEVKRVGESTVTAQTVVRTTKSRFSDQNLSQKRREGKDMVGTKNKEPKPSASLDQPPKQSASKSNDMMEIDQEQDIDIFEDLEDFAEESFHTAQSKESSESNELGSETMVKKVPSTNTASNSKEDDSDEDLDAFFSKLSNKPKIPAVRESHLSPTKPRSTKNSRGKWMDASWGTQSRTLFDDEESDRQQRRAAKQVVSSDEDTCGEEDVTQDFSCLQLESSSSSSDPESSSDTETERRSRPPAATTTTKKRTQTPSPPPKIPKLKPKPSSTTLPPPSPPKKLPRIPTTPHRPSSDLFWSRELVDDWNDTHSPTKKEPLFSSTKPPTSDATSTRGTSITSPKKNPPAASPSKATTALLARESRLARQLFDTHKHSLATHFLALLDARLTSSRLSALTASTGGIKIVWSKTLNTTAGRANWKKESITTTNTNTTRLPHSGGGGAKQKEGEKEVVTVKHHASIELATKVLSTPERLFNTLAHEFCHLAVFMIDGVTARPHGAEFKAWAKKVNESEFGAGGGGRNRGVGKMNIRDGGEGGEGVEWEGGYAVEVTTRHGYEIEFRYVWVCDGVPVPPPGGGGSSFTSGQTEVKEKGKGKGQGKEGCGTEYKRHSKSIDPKRHRCGLCKGILRQVKPAPRGQGQGQQQHHQGEGGGHLSDMAGGDGAGTLKGMGMMKEKGKTSEYQVFVKYQMKVVKAEKPRLTFGEVMKEVAERWKAEKARREKNKKGTPLAETSGKLSTVVEEVVADEDGDGEDSPDVFDDELIMDVVDLTADD
ncbi:SprT-like family-domain-containing protein [Neurospora hispaniola]|uniref:SprT-like family-domain-containing protein n=1 Tax=Neurospora hispaniola TaxID=588809 RepID=A0AAJ0MM12_9PEZI|nr:SprT-like family-domain-containing protein [Neurospora hispaniola]